MLQLRTFFPTLDKVRQVEFHPVQPWVVSCTKSNQVIVWDWKTNQVLHDILIGANDDEIGQDQEVSRLHVNDPVFSPNPSAISPSVVKGACGTVKDVRFLDPDVAQVALTSQHNLVNGTATPPPQAEHITALQGQRLLVVTCEYKILVYDMLTRKTTEIGRAALDGKSPTCVAFLFMAGYAFVVQKGVWVNTSPLLAVGCNDGIVRLVHLTSGRQVARLMDGHKTPIMYLYSTLARGHPYEQLVAGHQSGNIAMWEPLAKKVVQGGDVMAKMDAKAHEKQVVGIVQAATSEDPETINRLIFTAGQDNRVQGFDPTAASIKESTRIKLDPKGLVTALAYCPRGFSGSGTHTLLIGTEVGLVMSAHPVTGSIRVIANLANLIPCGHKKQPKIYSIAVHPVLPQHIVLGTNVGSVLMAIEKLAPLAVVSLPLSSASHAHTAQTRALEDGAPSGEVTYMSVVGDTVYCNTIATLPWEEAQTTTALTEVRGKLKIGTGKLLERALLTASCDGTYVGVSWPSSRQYAVYRQGAASWDEIANGCGSALAWHATEPVVAILEEPMPSTLSSTSATAAAAAAKPPKKLKGKEAEAAAKVKEAAERESAMAPSSISVAIRSMSGRTMSPSRRSLRLGNDTPVFVASGPLLAVTLKRQQAAGGDLMAGAAEPNVMQLFDWESSIKVGPEFSEPIILAWDPTLQIAALCYSSQVLLLRAQPTFSTIATIPIAGATCAEWALRQLYISTATHVYCIFVSTQTPRDTATAFTTHVIEIASSFDIVATPTALASSGPPSAPRAAALLPPPGPLPGGPLLLLGPREGYLWLVNAHAQALALPLLHPGFRCMCLAASGDLQGALTLAVKSLSLNVHDELASFFMDMDGSRGAGAALTLPGLSLLMEARIRLLLRQWPQALECCEALLAGFHRRPPAGSFVSSIMAAAFAPPAGNGLGVAGGTAAAGPASSSSAAALSPRPSLPPSMRDSFVDTGLEDVSLSASLSGTYDEVDWMQPMRHAGGSQSSIALAATEALCPPPARASHEAMELTLEVLVGLLSAGLLDVCKHTARMLLKYASDLDGMQMCRLSSCMASCGMKQELPQLVHRMGPGTETVGQEAAGLLAALLSGHTALAQDVLKQSGAVALAAAQAAAHRVEGAVSPALTAWKRQLKAGAGASGQTMGVEQSFAYLSVK